MVTIDLPDKNRAKVRLTKKTNGRRGKQITGHATVPGIMNTLFLVLCFSFISSINARGIRTRRDLGSVCQEMWSSAGNNLIVGTDMAVDTSSTAKQLFTIYPSGQAKLNSAVFVKFKALLDNYIPDEELPEATDASELSEQDAFINTIAAANGPVDIAYKYLKAAGIITAADLNAFKPILKKMWFQKYSKGGSYPNFSGFEHTFVGEVGVQRGTRVVKGLHSWYQFYLEQAAGRLEYAPPPKNAVDLTKKPPYINTKFSWNSVRKPPGSSFYIGTSPAFEIALYTACFFGEPGDCTCSIDGKPLKIKTINFNNAGMVLTSYPMA